MGQFSWIYSDTDKQMIDGKSHDSFLLVPPEFVGEFGTYHIKETCYDGYGRMGKYDVYDLVAYWNKKWIAENPDYITYRGTTLSSSLWYNAFAGAWVFNDFETFKTVVETNCGVELRDIGITIACYDEDNRSLENPIKIVEGENLTYNQAYPSNSDPNQGWLTYDDDTVYPEDITGFVGEWLDKDTSELPDEVVSLLERVYDLCEKEL